MKLFKPLLTFNGELIQATTIAVLYICTYNTRDYTIQVTRAMQFSNQMNALNAYANIPNPASPLATGKTREDFEADLFKVHMNLKDKEWVKNFISNYL